MDVVREKKVLELRSALCAIQKHALVVSGPHGSGKTSVIRAISEELGHNLIPIDSLCHYRERRMSPRDVYFIEECGMDRRDAGAASAAPLRGIVIETANKYFHRTVRSAGGRVVHVAINRPTVHAVKRILQTGDPRALEAVGGNLHKIKIWRALGEKERSTIMQGGAGRVELFHALGKIFYTNPVSAQLGKETSGIFQENIKYFPKCINKVGERESESERGGVLRKMEEIEEALEGVPEEKTLMYLFGNYLPFMGGVGDAERVLETLSKHCNRRRGCRREALLGLVGRLLFMQKKRPGTFLPFASPRTS